VYFYLLDFFPTKIRKEEIRNTENIFADK